MTPVLPDRSGTLPTDPERRADDARRLFDRADLDGSVALATLSDVEEYVLGADRWLLVDGPGWLAWLAIGDEARDRHTAETVRDLLERGDAVHVDESDDGYEITLSAPWGLMELARMSAYFTVVPSVSPRDCGVVAPLLYGIVDEVAGLRGFVTELRQPGRHVYRLLSVERACAALAEWTQGALLSEEYGGRAAAAVLEVLRHRDGEEPQAAGLSVSVDGEQLRGASLLFGGHRDGFDAADRDTLTAQIRVLLQQAAGTTGEPR